MNKSWFKAFSLITILMVMLMGTLASTDTPR